MPAKNELTWEARLVGCTFKTQPIAKDKIVVARDGIIDSGVMLAWLVGPFRLQVLH